MQKISTIGLVVSPEFRFEVLKLLRHGMDRCLVTIKAKMINNQLCRQHHEAGHVSLLKVEGLFSRRCDL